MCWDEEKGEMKLNKSGKRSIYTPCLTYSAGPLPVVFLLHEKRRVEIIITHTKKSVLLSEVITQRERERERETSL